MLSVEDIRTYAKDTPEYNVLLEGEYQSVKKLVELAMKLTVGDFNIVAPVTGYTLEYFPSDTVMLYGVLHHLANGEAERQLRNQVTYNAQGLNAGIDDKFPQYNQLAQYYKGLFDQKLREFKMYINQEKAWGGSFSPYMAINEYRFRN